MTQAICSCGNPAKMYWCPECQSNSETDKCDSCGRKIFIDTEYHEGCTPAECAHQFNIYGTLSREKRCVKCGFITKDN